MVCCDCCVAPEAPVQARIQWLPWSCFVGARVASVSPAGGAAWCWLCACVFVLENSWCSEVLLFTAAKKLSAAATTRFPI